MPITYKGIIATDAPVKPVGTSDLLMESIIIVPGMALPEKIPLIDNHLRGSITTILGHAENLRVEAVTGFYGQEVQAIVGDIIFSHSHNGSQAESDVLRGHLWALSAGYEARGRQFVNHGCQETLNGVKCGGGNYITGMDLHEVSLCVLPKDRNCKVIVVHAPEEEPEA